MRYGNEKGSYTINDLPGSPQVAVSTHSFVYPHLRGKGYGSSEHQHRLAELRRLGYNYVICTVRADNAPELAILQKHHWSRLAEFKSSSTKSVVYIYGRTVQ